jgi:DNA polymerase-3 subunit delta
MDSLAQKTIADLKARRYAPVYLLQGEEPYYIDLVSDFIEANVLSESEKGFNQVVLYGKDSPVNVILNHARRFPMMAERQVVVVREAQEIPDLGKELGQKLMLSYLERPVPSTLLVLCHKYKSLDKRKELGKKADQLALSLNFKRIQEKELPGFVNEFVRGKGHKIEDDAIRVLCESVGTDLSRMTSEISKVVGSKGQGSTVTAVEIMNQVGMSREFNVFELQKALIRQDKAKACLITDYFTSNTRKNSPIMIVAFLYSFYSKLYAFAAASLKSEGTPVNALKISPYAMGDYSSALQRYPVSRLEENVMLLKETDLRLKGVNAGSTGDGQLLKELVLRLVR